MKAFSRFFQNAQAREFVAAVIGLGVIAISPVLILSLLCDAPTFSIGVTLVILALSTVAYFVAPKDEEL